MIQRIQSIFLLLAIVMNILILFIPYWKDEAKTDKGVVITTQLDTFSKQTITVEDEKTQVQTKIFIWSLILNSIIIIISIVTIFIFKNRMLQYKFSRLLMLVSAGMVVMLIYQVDATNITSNFKNYTYSALFPIVAIIMYFLSARAIMKDEKMVQDSERFR